jgi:regulator of replication initiation timing
MGILDNAKQVAKAVEEIHNLELYQRVLGLHSDIIELVEENNRLRNENSELKTQKDISSRLRLLSNTLVHAYFLRKEDGGQEDGPFCTTCWDIDRKLVRPFSYTNDQNQLRYLCEYCRSHRSSRH